MAEQVLSRFTNNVKWKNDKASFNGAMKDLKAYRKEVEAINKAMGKGGVGGGGGGSTSRNSYSSKAANGRHKVTKELEKRDKSELKRALQLNKIKQDALKTEQALQSAKIKQSVGGVTSSNGSGKASQSVFADMLREEDRLEKKITSTLNKQMFHEKGISEEQRKQFAQALRSAPNQEEFLKRSRLIHNQVRDTNRMYRDNEKSLKRQNFLLQRMDNSSKQFAGNMVSAFAVAGAGAYILQTGGAFESVDSTMLAVSKDSKEAGENLAYVREEARRLGLSLVESSKGFAKLTAARGEVSLSDTRELFSGVSELSTLLGLTTVESGRALTAIQQINGLPCIEIYL